MGIRGNAPVEPGIRRCSSSQGELAGEHHNMLNSSSSSLDEQSGPNHQVREGSSSGSDVDSDSESEGSNSGNNVYLPRRGPIPRWARSLSDSLLHMQGGRAFHTSSLPALLMHPPEQQNERPSPPKGIRPSQARIIIPRTISEYFDCCRYSKSHSDGLLLASTTPTGAMTGCRNLVPRALSEGLLGGRLFAAASEGRDHQPSGTPEKSACPAPLEIEQLQEGMEMEGKIMRSAAFGFLVEVGAVRTGLLRRSECKGVPKKILRPGEILSNVVVVRVDRKKKRFTLRLVGLDGPTIDEQAYLDILHHIADWAGVKLPARDEVKDPESHVKDEASASKRNASEQQDSSPAVPPLKLPKNAASSAAETPKDNADSASCTRSSRRSGRRGKRRSAPRQPPARKWRPVAAKNANS